MNENQLETKEKVLNNFSIKELTDQRGDNYYLVLDNEAQDKRNNGYFCFNSSTQAFELISSQYNQNNQPSLSALNIEYEESEKNGRKVRRIISIR